VVENKLKKKNNAEHWPTLEKPSPSVTARTVIK